jgi:hypothetical protein
VQVDFAQWGTIYLAPGAETNWWFTWIFDGNHWSRMSAVPLPESPAGSSQSTPGSVCSALRFADPAETAEWG